MKTIGKLFLLLSFVVVGRWSRPNPPVITATFSELMAPANHSSPGTSSPVVLVRNGSQQTPFTSALALF